MRRISFSSTLLIAMAVSTLSWGEQEPTTLKIPAPEFEGINAWINTKPLSLKDLQGKVAVVHFWAFG